MAKSLPKDEEKKEKFPSDFGSHTSMIDEAETAKLEDSRQVCLRDAYGLYVTLRDRLDTGLADMNRYCRADITKNR